MSNGLLSNINPTSEEFINIDKWWCFQCDKYYKTLKDREYCCRPLGGDENIHKSREKYIDFPNLIVTARGPRGSCTIRRPISILNDSKILIPPNLIEELINTIKLLPLVAKQSNSDIRNILRTLNKKEKETEIAIMREELKELKEKYEPETLKEVCKECGEFWEQTKIPNLIGAKCIFIKKLNRCSYCINQKKRQLINNLSQKLNYYNIDILWDLIIKAKLSKELTNGDF
jgi:hypothetical protein